MPQPSLDPWPSPILFRFGAYEVDFRVGELRKSGVRIKVQDQPLQVLEMMLEHPGELVTREQLRQRLWPADTFVDFDHSLNSAVKKLRLALGDDAEAPRFIETLHKHGYRFIAPVEATVGEEKPVARPPEALRPEPLPPHRRFPRYVLVSAALLLLGAVLVGLRSDGARNRLWRGRKSQQASPAPIRSLAVLPLQNLSQDPDQEYFADGLTDALITDLGKLAGFRVISHTSVATYEKTTKPLPQIARELNVEAIVEGTVLRSGGRLRVTVQLVRTSPEEHLWAERYERDDEDVIRLEQHLALAIAHEITGRLITTGEAGLAGKPTINPKAYDAYLRGRYLWNERSAKPAFEAGAYFEEALREDPNFALAYSGLADYYCVSWGPWTDLPRSERYARKAVALQPDLAEAHASLGIAAQYQGKFEEAERELTRAIELNPNYVMAHHWYSLWLLAMGHLNEALAENDRARQLDPFAFPVSFQRAQILMGMHEYDETIEQLETATAINPRALAVHFYRARVYWIQGKGANAIADEKEEARLANDPAQVRDLDKIAGIFTSVGLRAAELQLARLKEKACTDVSGKDWQPPYACDEFGIALRYGALGEEEKLLYWLKRSLDPNVLRHRQAQLLYSKTAPEFDFVRPDHRFRDLLRSVGLPE